MFRNKRLLAMLVSIFAFSGNLFAADIDVTQIASAVDTVWVTFAAVLVFFM